MFLDRKARLEKNGEYGPSIVTISDDEILVLVSKYKGTGEVKYNLNGEWNRQEIILDNDKAIGIVVNNMTGESVETTVFKIHYSDKGVHIVPDYPSKKKRRTK